MRKRALRLAGACLLVVICFCAYLWLRGPRYAVTIGRATAVPHSGTYSLSVRYQAAAGAGDFVVELDGRSVPFHVERTVASATVDLGTWELERPGKHVVEIHRDSPVPPITFESVDLAPTSARP